MSPGTKEFGFCDLHEELTDEATYRYKGCWGCQHFEFGQTFPYLFVSEAAKELQVSESTVRRWTTLQHLQETQIQLII